MNSKEEFQISWEIWTYVGPCHILWFGGIYYCESCSPPGNSKLSRTWVRIPKTKYLGGTATWQKNVNISCPVFLVQNAAYFRIWNCCILIGKKMKVYWSSTKCNLPCFGKSPLSRSFPIFTFSFDDVERVNRTKIFTVITEIVQPVW